MENSQIKVKADSLPVRYVPGGLEFADGSRLRADVIVFATGFRGNMKYMAEEIFGPEIAEQMGDFFTLDEEGELKGAFKPCGRKPPSPSPLPSPLPLPFLWVRNVEAK